MVDGKLLAMRYQDSKEVYFLSTMHRPKLVVLPKRNRNGDEILKQQLVNDYNQNMGFVDKCDSVINQHGMVRKSHKWTTKCAFHLIDEAIFNARVLHTTTSIEKPLSFLDFKITFIKEIFDELPAMSAPPSEFSTHNLESVPVPANKNVKSHFKRCSHCYKNGIRKETKYQCDSCPKNPGFCVDPCFKVFHKHE